MFLVKVTEFKIEKCKRSNVVMRQHNVWCVRVCVCVCVRACVLCGEVCWSVFNILEPEFYI